MRELSSGELEQHVRNMAEDGFTLVEDAIPADLSRELKDALAEVEETHDIGYRDTPFEGTRTVRIYNLLAYHRAFEKVPLSPVTLPIAERVLDRELQLSSLSAICLGPGQEPQPIHSDSQMLPFPRPHLPVSVNAMWALTDFTEANGATRIVPGSHLYDHNPAYDGQHASDCAEMPTGSILLWNSALWHGGGGNTTDARRDGLACSYCAGWMRPQENQQLGIPMERLRQFPRRLQELCGFSVYQGIYGHIDNADPITLLGREQTRGMVWQAASKSKKAKQATE